jgi:hypothetical protein
MPVRSRRNNEFVIEASIESAIGSSYLGVAVGLGLFRRIVGIRGDDE